jgi:hypothetical protein
MSTLLLSFVLGLYNPEDLVRILKTIFGPTKAPTDAKEKAEKEEQL